MKASLYVHVPFCAVRCGYCSFYSTVPEGPSILWRALTDRYLRALFREAEEVSRCLGGIEATTLYIGGGTPSLLGRSGIQNIVSLARGMGLAPGAEVTFEANPDDLVPPGSKDSRRESRDFGSGPPEGVTRVSVGVQTFNDRLLAYLGRRHDGPGALRALEAVARWGTRMSADLIFAIPGQGVADFMTDLETVVSSGCGHVSLYDLHLEEGAPLAARVFSRCESEALEEAGATMYAMARRRLRTLGLKRYEVSNFARSGMECRHNLSYWSDFPYIGLGPGAHSRVAGLRWHNEPDLDTYLREFGDFSVGSGAVRPFAAGAESSAGEVAIGSVADPGELFEALSPSKVRRVTALTRGERMTDYMIMGLRKAGGIDGRSFEETFGTTLDDEWGRPLEKLTALGLVKRDARGVRLTTRGFDLGNQVFIEFV